MMNNPDDYVVRSIYSPEWHEMMRNSTFKNCGRCGKYYNDDWDKDGGCPSCQHITGYPAAFYSTEAYAQERRDQKEKDFQLGISHMTAQEMTQEDFSRIVIDLAVGGWRDERAYEMVEGLVRHILSIDADMKVPTTSKAPEGYAEG